MDEHVERGLIRLRDELTAIRDTRGCIGAGVIVPNVEVRVTEKVWASLVNSAIGTRDPLLLSQGDAWVDPFPDRTACAFWWGERVGIEDFQAWATKASPIVAQCHQGILAKAGYHGLLQAAFETAANHPSFGPLVQEWMLNVPPRVGRTVSGVEFFTVDDAEDAPALLLAFLDHLRGAPVGGERLVVDAENQQVIFDGEKWILDRPYVLVLDALARAKGEPRTRSEIESIHPDLKNESRIDRLIRYLRKQYRPLGKHILTARGGKGYYLDLWQQSDAP